jgi:hypothetical protein
VRCISGPLTRTEILFWGLANRGDASAVVPVAVELSRIHPDGSSTLLKRETLDRLSAGESQTFQYAYPVVLCVTADPRLPWPEGGRFRVTLEGGGVRRTADAPDP